MADSIKVEIKVTPINKDNWQDKLASLRAKYPSIKEINLEFHEDKVEEFVEQIYTRIGATIDKTKEEFHKLVNSL